MIKLDYTKLYQALNNPLINNILIVNKTKATSRLKYKRRAVNSNYTHKNTYEYFSTFEVKLMYYFLNPEEQVGHKYKTYLNKLRNPTMKVLYAH